MRCWHSSDASSLSCRRPRGGERLDEAPRPRGRLMDKAVLLAVAASLCTATASVCQRAGARNTGPAAGFDARLMIRLARQPAWLLGIAAMIGGFVFQITALRFGELALVQPILAAELLFVFGYLAVAGSRRPKLRDWLAAAAMSAGIGVFLRLAAPSGGRLHAPGSSWLLAGLITAGVVAAALAVASGLGRRPGASRGRRAAVLGAATGISWGFMAAVIKELSAHLGGGPGAVVSAWSLYLLLAAGAVTMLLAEHAPAARQYQAALSSAASALPATRPPADPADPPVPGTCRTRRPPALSPQAAARADRTRPGPAPAAARTGPPRPARGHQDLDPEPAAA